MRLRELGAIIVSLIVVACGVDDTPTSPTSTPLNLGPGTYALTVTMATSGLPTCSNGLCASVSLCGGPGAPPSVSGVTTAVRLDRSGDLLTIRADDASASLRMDLRIELNTVSGNASGEFRDSNLQLSLESVVVRGTVLPTGVTGSLEGRVGIGGYSCSNNAHAFRLVPR